MEERNEKLKFKDYEVRSLFLATKINKQDKCSEFSFWNTVWSDLLQKNYKQIEAITDHFPKRTVIKDEMRKKEWYQLYNEGNLFFHREPRDVLSIYIHSGETDQQCINTIKIVYKELKECREIGKYLEIFALIDGITKEHKNIICVEEINDLIISANTIRI